MCLLFSACIVNVENLWLRQSELLLEWLERLEYKFLWLSAIRKLVVLKVPPYNSHNSAATNAAFPVYSSTNK